MSYLSQQNLIIGLQGKNRNLFDFLTSIDKFLSTLSNTSSASIVTCKQNNFPKLTANQPQFIYVADFAHLIYWDGATSPVFADGGNNFYALSDIVPNATGWVQVAGQSVNYLTPYGKLVSKTLLDTTATAAFLKATNTTPASFTSPVKSVLATTTVNNPASGTATTVATGVVTTEGTPESFNSKLWFRL